MSDTRDELVNRILTELDEWKKLVIRLDRLRTTEVLSHNLGYPNVPGIHDLIRSVDKQNRDALSNVSDLLEKLVEREAPLRVVVRQPEGRTLLIRCRDDQASLDESMTEGEELEISGFHDPSDDGSWIVVEEGANSVVVRKKDPQ